MSATDVVKEGVPELAAYRSLWLGGKETGPSAWNRKFELADAAIEALCLRIIELEGGST